MNIKLHTPKSLKTGSGMSTLKQLLMSIVATSISIILTFGTAYFVDKNKKLLCLHRLTPRPLATAFKTGVKMLPLGV